MKNDQSLRLLETLSKLHLSLPNATMDTKTVREALSTLAGVLAEVIGELPCTDEPKGKKPT